MDVVEISNACFTYYFCSNTKTQREIHYDKSTLNQAWLAILAFVLELPVCLPFSFIFPFPFQATLPTLCPTFPTAFHHNPLGAFSLICF